MKSCYDSFQSWPFYCAVMYVKSRMDLTQSLVHVETTPHTAKGCEKVYYLCNEDSREYRWSLKQIWNGFRKQRWLAEVFIIFIRQGWRRILLGLNLLPVPSEGNTSLLISLIRCSVPGEEGRLRLKAVNSQIYKKKIESDFLLYIVIPCTIVNIHIIHILKLRTCI